MRLVARLDWDSAFFGLPIGMISRGLEPELLPTAVREADEAGLRCTYLLAGAAEIGLLERSQQLGYVLRDVRIELQRPVVGHPTGTTGLRQGTLEDLAELEPVARSRFTDTRFFADPGLASRGGDLYVEWLRKGLEPAPGMATLVMDDLSGFVTCRLDRAAGEGLVALIAVAEEESRKGLGRRLVAGAGSLFAEAGLGTASVVTQGRNVAAQRLYQRSGYTTERVSVWLHRWRP